jgi:hypothetical protein
MNEEQRKELGYKHIQHNYESHIINYNNILEMKKLFSKNNNEE